MQKEIKHGKEIHEHECFAMPFQIFLSKMFPYLSISPLYTCIDLNVFRESDALLIYLLGLELTYSSVSPISLVLTGT